MTSKPKEDRLAEALRANLRRRKDQARSRKDDVLSNKMTHDGKTQGGKSDTEKSNQKDTD